jgi:hypothetical protein
MAPKVPETRAWQALVTLIARKSQKQVCLDSGVNQSTLSLIASLQRMPGRKTALALEKVGIKGPWWEQPSRPSKAPRAA